MSGGGVQIIVIPFLQASVADVVEALHLPVAEVDFQNAPVALRVAVAAIVGKAGATAQRTGEDGVERSVALQCFASGGCFFFKRASERNIALTVTGARSHVNRSVADENNVHII